MMYFNLVCIFILFVLVFKLWKRKPIKGKDGIGFEPYKEGLRARNQKGEIVIEYSKPLKK